MAEKKVPDCIKALESAQQADHDSREMVREADLFVNKRDGQWEPQIISKFNDKPRYTFDEVNPIIDDVMGEMATADFDINVDPAGGEASKDIANAFEGIIRHIENLSRARFIYDYAARKMVTTGLHGWRVVADYPDSDSFQQELMIERIPNYTDSVWFDENSTEPDHSDAGYCWVLSSMTRSAYEEDFPKGSGISVGSDIRQQAYSYKKTDEVKVGEYLYKVEKTRELALLSNGAVVVVDENFNMIRDELHAQRITVQKTRKRPYKVVYQRLFDGMDWLSDAQETVFEWLPIIPLYANFTIIEDKIVYWGIVEKLMDPQRIINYSESRKVNEGALAPRGKVWMPKEQAKSPDVKMSLRTLNVNNEPVQFYDWEEGQPPPNYMGAPVSNPHLIELTQTSQNFIQRSSGTFDEARGVAPAQRSGKAIGLLQDKSDNPKRKWFQPVEIGLTHTCRILINAIPKVYDTQQEMTLVNQDGTTDSITIRQKVIDMQTGKVVELNDLSKGKYQVVCSAGPAFHSRQQETVQSIYELADRDPSILQIGADVLLNNIASPGVDLIAARKRKQMLAQGLIPEEQLTDDEKAEMQAAQGQPKPPDPMMIAAQAEMLKAQTKQQTEGLKIEMEQNKLRLKEMELTLKSQTDQSRTMIDSMKALNEQIKVQADTLKAIKEAIGADTIMNPHAVRAYDEQAKDLARTILTQ